MNDKCAAGTGRFLEMIARTLEVSLDELGGYRLDFHREDRDHQYVFRFRRVRGDLPDRQQ